MWQVSGGYRVRTGKMITANGVPPNSTKGIAVSGWTCPEGKCDCVASFAFMIMT
jgi:hypothetical protein